MFLPQDQIILRRPGNLHDLNLARETGAFVLALVGNCMRRFLGSLRRAMACTNARDSRH